MTTLPHVHAPAWSPDSWRMRPDAQPIPYPQAEAVASATARLAQFPPLVTSWEIERLKTLIAEAQEGRRFLLQGGDCAERLDDCSAESVTSRLKILLQMALVLAYGIRRPVIRVGRFAGQYAKPRSHPFETRLVDGAPRSLPSYFGDMINRPAFTPEARRPDPGRLVEAYQHAAMTLNFVRSLCDAGFADLHHPEYWNLSFFAHASLSEEVRRQYEAMSRELASSLRFMEALGERSVDDLSRTTFYTSHEGLVLEYETALTRQVPRREGWYNLSTHLPWIGERTRQLDGAHVEYFRGIANPVGLKIGAGTDPIDLLRLVDRLNPINAPGKLVVITRMGADNVNATLPGLVEIVRSAGKRVLWVCDPMHGNTAPAPDGRKTRSFNAILEELDRTIDIHRRLGSWLGGVHFELTGDDVTECIGGASGVTEADLNNNYATLCDPRLNYQQALEMAFLLSRKLGN
ncbi:MAG: 3-deoxy-7-phosphoheptulonate synthase [Phycisphaeraceae bacterium]|nr:3-deoxy-7-phosphoheptulonate synthase [Phycisphaeraceae bacterium]